jgi:hypothetical protein
MVFALASKFIREKWEENNTENTTQLARETLFYFYSC